MKLTKALACLKAKCTRVLNDEAATEEQYGVACGVAAAILDVEYAQKFVGDVQTAINPRLPMLAARLKMFNFLTLVGASVMMTRTRKHPVAARADRFAAQGVIDAFDLLRGVE